MLKYVATIVISCLVFSGLAQAQLGNVMYEGVSKSKYNDCRQPAPSMTLETLLPACEKAVNQLQLNISVATKDSPESFVDGLIYKLAESEFRTTVIKKHSRKFGAGKVCAHVRRINADMGWASHTPDTSSSLERAVKAIHRTIEDCKTQPFDIAPPLDTKLTGNMLVDNPHLGLCESQKTLKSCQKAADEMDKLTYWENSKVRDLDFLGLTKADYSQTDRMRFKSAEIFLFQYQIAGTQMPRSLDSMKKLCPYIEHADQRLSQFSSPPTANSQAAQYITSVKGQLSRCKNIDKMIQMQKGR